MTTRKISMADFAKDPTLASHSQRSKAVARALDEAAESLPFARSFTSFEFEEFLTQLTPKRFELLRLASKGQKSIADLALASRRDPSAVSRDVSKLSELGLVNVHEVVNEGHGRKKVVTPAATTISITASITAA
jgi:predicted transcriptional regulator